MRRLTRVVVFAILPAAVAGCSVEGQGVQKAGRAPSFSLAAADGRVVSSDSLKGQVVLVSFWSTTCGPCVREVPDLQHLDDSGRAKVVAIALDPGGWKVVRPFVERHAIRYSVLLGNEEVFERFDGYAPPYSLLLDSEQQVARVYRGAVSRSVVERDIEALGPRAGE